MPEYTYHAIDRTGVSVHGVMTADSEYKLEDHLHEIGYWLIDAKSQSRRTKIIKTRASRRELIDFFNGMAALLEAGVNAADALKAMVEETSNESFKYVLEDIEMNVQSGTSFYDAVSKYPNIFSEQLSNLIHAGEFSGNLAITFHDLSQHLEWVDRLMADVKQASIYPGMVIFAVGGLISLLLSVVVPKFTSIFISAGLKLPALTQAVVTVGNYWLIILALLVSTIFMMWASARYISGVKRIIDKLKFNMPVFGAINRMLVMSRFVHNLSLMVKSGVPILQALGLCRKLVASVIMEEAVKSAELAVNEGRRMSEALREHEIISPLVLRMLVVGEETGHLDRALKHVSTRFDEEIPRQIKRAFGIMEPLIILTLIMIVGLVAAAVFMPMFTLMSGLGK